MVRRASTDENTISVKVAVLGGEVREFELEEAATVKDALAAAGLSESSRVKSGGEDVGLSDVLEDGDRLVVTSEVKGGYTL